MLVAPRSQLSFFGALADDCPPTSQGMCHTSVEPRSKRPQYVDAGKTKSYQRLFERFEGIAPCRFQYLKCSSPSRSDLRLKLCHQPLEYVTIHPGPALRVKRFHTLQLLTSLIMAAQSSSPHPCFKSSSRHRSRTLVCWWFLSRVYRDSFSYHGEPTQPPKFVEVAQNSDQIAWVMSSQTLKAAFMLFFYSFDWMNFIISLTG